MAPPPSSVPSFSFKRRLITGFHVIVSIVLLALLVGMVNYLGFRHFKRIHLSREVNHQLSERTKQILRSLDKGVEVIAFYNHEDSMFSRVDGLLKEYSLASKHIRYQSVDYLSDPVKAMEVKRQFKLADYANDDLIIFNQENRTQIIQDSQLSDYDINAVMSGQRKDFPITGFKGEILFTSAILSVSDPNPIKGYYLQGHKEHPMESESEFGYLKFIELLNQNNIEVKPLKLVYGEEVPLDCGLLIIAGAINTLAPVEVDQIQRYLERGRNLFLLLNNRRMTPNGTGLEATLKKWGIDAGLNVVHDFRSPLPQQFIVVDHYAKESHPITRPLIRNDLPLQLGLARSIRKYEEAIQADPDLVVKELAYTSDKGVARSRIKDGKIVPAPDDPTGEIPVMAAIEKMFQAPNRSRVMTRMVVCGDSLFLSNQFMPAMGNRDFADLAINWLVNRTVRVSDIGPRVVHEYRIDLSENQARRLYLVFLAGIPGAILFLGLLVWWPRRN